MLAGMEANIRGVDGRTDITPDVYDDFDLFVAGKHVMIAYDSFRDFRRYFWGNLIEDKLKKGRIRPKNWWNTTQKRTSKRLKTTRGHHFAPWVSVSVRRERSGEVRARLRNVYRTEFQKSHLSDEELFEAYDTGVRFVMDSDAHTASRVGDFALAEEQIKRVGLPTDRIDNIDGRLPSFRFAAFKAKR